MCCISSVGNIFVNSWCASSRSLGIYATLRCEEVHAQKARSKLTVANNRRNIFESLTSRAQAHGSGDTGQPVTSRQTEGAIPRCLQRFVRQHRFHRTNIQ